MTTHSTRLLLDAGNSRLKWAVVRGAAWLSQGSAAYSELSGLVRELPQVDACFIASVAKRTDVENVTSSLLAHELAPVQLQTEPQFGEVKNTYAQPDRLGVDRWMGLIAARARSTGPCLVVSAGTAMTVDALDANGVFLGGLIVPGVDLMRQALRQGTARVAEVDGEWQPFPRSTADGVESGIVAALCGAIVQQHAQLVKQAASVPHCILTGGAAAVIAPHLPFDVEFAPVLVLEGMDLVTRKDSAG